MKLRCHKKLTGKTDLLPLNSHNNKTDHAHLSTIQQCFIALVIKIYKLMIYWNQVIILQILNSYYNKTDLAHLSTIQQCFIALVIKIYKIMVYWNQINLTEILPLNFHNNKTNLAHLSTIPLVIKIYKIMIYWIVERCARSISLLREFSGRRSVFPDMAQQPWLSYRRSKYEAEVS